MSHLLEAVAQLDPQRSADLAATDEAERIAADVARDGPGKGARLAAVNDLHALDLQVQFQGFIGELPA
jgi:hypothetical protein